jgi:hypothetical protein
MIKCRKTTWSNSTMALETSGETVDRTIASVLVVAKSTTVTM